MKEHSRIIHASQLRLDQQVGGLRHISRISRPTLRDCTLLAFDRLVEFGCQESVELVLLTGGLWQVEERSPRAAKTFLNGCRRLAERGIPVVVDVPDLKTFLDGLCGAPLPHNVELLRRDDSRDLSVTGARGRLFQFRPLAEFESSTSTIRSTSPERLQSTEIRIGVSTSSENLFIGNSPLSLVGGVPSGLDFDYIALAHSPRGRTLDLGGDLAHCPGPLQGLTPIESGPCGATLVEGLEGDSPRLTHYPLATVRWEQWGVEADPSANRESLLESFLLVLAENSADAPEVPRLIRWNLHAADWPRSLRCESEVIAGFLSELDRRGREFGCQAASQSLLLLPTSESTLPLDPLHEEFNRFLTERTATGRSVLRGIGIDFASRWNWPRLDIERSLSGPALSRIAAEARSIGDRWLESTERIDA